MTNQEPIHVITILWGNAYGEEDVNKLYSMICRNTSFSVHFHLFSNESLPNINPEILKYPEPVLSVSVDHRRYNYRKTVGLCDNELAGLKGKRVFFFDLDVLVMDNLDELFTYPKDDQFYIINDWNTRGDTVGQATCYSYIVGTLGFIKEAFESAPDAVINRFKTATQQYLSMMLIQKHGKLNFWPEAWFQSFRYHCLPIGPLRHICMPHLPKLGTKVLAFHGHPDIHDALMGRWSKPGIGKSARGWKKLYKACKPTPWINKYWL